MIHEDKKNILNPRRCVDFCFHGVSEYLFQLIQCLSVFSLWYAADVV